MNSVNSLDALFDLSATTASSSPIINSEDTDVSNVICEAEPSNDELLLNHNNAINIGDASPTISPQQASANNKKRTRATPEQLAILEDTFKTNTSPNSKVREALAEKVSMSERSIQIWFQNRRAKMKAVQKRAHLMINQESLNHFMTCMPPSYGNIYPFRMPIHQHPQRIALPNVAFSAGMRPQPNISNNQPQPQQQYTPPLQQYSPPQEFITPSAFNNTSVTLMPCETLTIGTWRRILTIQEPKDLLCYYTLPQDLITYHITNDNTHFKMEFPFIDITSIEYRPIDESTSQLAIEVKDTPRFFMESPHGKWNMCKDFTEDRQASRHMRHVIKGRSAFMKPALIKLMQDNSDLAKVVTILDSPNNASYPSPSSSITDSQINNAVNCDNKNIINNDIMMGLQQLQQNNDQPLRRSSFPVPANNNNSFINGNSINNDNGLCINGLSMNNNSSSANELLQNIHRLRRSASVPLTPNNVFDSSPTIIQSSPLLNQHPFVGFQSSHNLSHLQMDSETSTILSDEQIAASMISFNDDTSFMNGMNLEDPWGSDIASFLLDTC
ncbi:16559_t:CDS:2 [Entrophospora sp. SA101]|nr:16559_t:CDS:2 [Entrophospora sp. SA101]